MSECPECRATPLHASDHYAHCSLQGVCVPPAAPEMPERVVFERQSFSRFDDELSMTIDKFRALLGTQGLSICTEAERKYLDSTPQCQECGLRACQEPSVGERFPSGKVHCNSCARKVSELARRENR